MQNSQEIKIDVDDHFNPEQVKTLKQRYYTNLAWMDRMANTYQQLSMINTVVIYLSLTAGLLVSVITANIVLVALFSISLLWLSTLKAHYQALQERLDVLVDDLTLSESQLNKAVVSNVKLQTKLEEAMEENSKVLHCLVESRKEIEKIAEQAIIKDLEIEGARQQLAASSEKITALTTDLMGQKIKFSEKMSGFFMFLDKSRLEMEQSRAMTSPQGQ